MVVLSNWVLVVKVVMRVLRNIWKLRFFILVVWNFEGLCIVISNCYYFIVVILGDGIGKEVMFEGICVFEVVGVRFGFMID